jgi:hypothetical protein
MKIFAILFYKNSVTYQHKPREFTKMINHNPNKVFKLFKNYNERRQRSKKRRKKKALGMEMTTKTALNGLQANGYRKKRKEINRS